MEFLPDSLAGIISASVKVASKKETVRSGLQQYVQAERANLKDQYCLIIDEESKTEQMKEEEEDLRQFTTEDGKPLFVIVNSLQEARSRGFRGRQIVHLSDITADYEELRRREARYRILYGPLPYLRSSLYVTASIALAQGDVRRLEQINPLALELIKDLYGQYLSGGVSSRNWNNYLLSHGLFYLVYKG